MLFLVIWYTMLNFDVEIQPTKIHPKRQVARKQWGVDAPSIIEVGARVQSYHHLEAR